MTSANELFSESVVTAVAAHMNGDHADDNLLIARALGDAPSATAARMTGLDAEGVTLVAEIDGGERTVRVPWKAVPTERAEIRHEVVRMYREACALLGVEPREEEG